MEMDNGAMGGLKGGRATLAVPTNRFDALLDTYRPCLRRAWIPRTLASRIHLFAEGVTPDSPGSSTCSTGTMTTRRRW
jgi:hypothetical protein